MINMLRESRKAGAFGTVSHPREIEQEAINRAYLFGPFRIFHGERRLDLEGTGRKKALQILQWFLLNPGKPCSADQFIEELWPHCQLEKAIGNLHVSVHTLRRLLEPELGPRKDSTFIRRHPGRVYSFEPEGKWWTDVADIQLLYQRGRECDLGGEAGRACYYYRRVSSYVTQGFLADCDTSAWFDAYKRKYQQICSQSLMRLMQLYMSVQDDEELVECAYQMLQIDQYNELATRVIIEANLRAGNRGGAQLRLESFCDSVRRELGVPPSRQLNELRLQLTDHRNSAKNGTFEAP